uniref:AlNc14C249G9616 protein n=1 Tax=Albugo laibachii Nc14 TaxID=890382 RepID=F0WTD6_9STRA|nr:AlNc14C249G9616 [Albugo laibachii Nc14]|eukprot:CCA24626.1 AlNc14C249G9616 [Albugo laibachii Nc14]
MDGAGGDLKKFVETTTYRILQQIHCGDGQENRSIKAIDVKHLMVEQDQVEELPMQPRA